MDATAILEQARDLGARRVFGEPYEKNGVTVIPAARVFGGAGGGDSGSRPSGDGEATGAKAPAGMGVGYGMSGSPAGAFVIKGSDVQWMPALDVNRIVFGMQVMLIVLFFMIRSVAKARIAKS